VDISMYGPQNKCCGSWSN